MILLPKHLISEFPVSPTGDACRSLKVRVVVFVLFFFFAHRIIFVFLLLVCLMFKRAAAHLFVGCYFPLLIIELYLNVM